MRKQKKRDREREETRRVRRWQRPNNNILLLLVATAHPRTTVTGFMNIKTCQVEQNVTLKNAAICSQQRKVRKKSKVQHENMKQKSGASRGWNQQGIESNHNKINSSRGSDGDGATRSCLILVAIAALAYVAFVATDAENFT